MAPQLAHFSRMARLSMIKGPSPQARHRSSRTCSWVMIARYPCTGRRRQALRRAVEDKLVTSEPPAARRESLERQSTAAAEVEHLFWFRHFERVPAQPVLPIVYQRHAPALSILPVARGRTPGAQE